MIIVKLGGSFITYKRMESKVPLSDREIDRSYSIKRTAILRAGKTLKPFVQGGLIIVHGGGTHGHRTVQRWRMGMTRMKGPMMPWEVRLRMDQLSLEVAKTLGEAGIPAYPISPPDIIQAESGRISFIDPGPLNRVLGRGMVPILRGDLVPDGKDGWSVISGDDQILRLVELSKSGHIPLVDRVIMCMDVPGILEPGHVGDRIIGEIDPGSYHDLIRSIETTSSGDVSGGIMKKLRTSHSIASWNVPVDLIGGSSNALSDLMTGTRTGTRFTPFKGDRECADDTRAGKEG